MVELRALRRFVKRAGYSVVHVNWLAMPALDLRFIEWLGNQGVAVVVTMHNARPHEADSLPSTSIEVCRKADRVVTLGEVIDYVIDSVKRETKYQQHPAAVGDYDRAMPLAAQRR